MKQNKKENNILPFGANAANPREVSLWVDHSTKIGTEAHKKFNPLKSRPPSARVTVLPKKIVFWKNLSRRENSKKSLPNG